MFFITKLYCKFCKTFIAFATFYLLIYIFLFGKTPSNIKYPIFLVLLRYRYNVGKYYAERLVRTETKHFNNEADAMAYEEMGIDKYVFVATLDNRTSEKCQEHDNKVYDYKDKQTGVNFPPLHPNCRSTTRGYLGEEQEKNLKRRARNPETGKTELIDNISYKEWLKSNNIVGTKNGKFITKNNITYNTTSLSKLDKTLVNTNIARLNELLTEYPKVAKFVEENGLNFGGKITNAIAVTSHTYDMNNLGIHLSSNYYKDSKVYIDSIKSNIKSKNFMPCNENNIKVYALNHEYGHLVENYLINEYNKNNLSDYGNYLTRIRTATTKEQIRLITNKYENKICDKISQDIYEIAIKNNSDFKLNENLSKYGYESSQEFFAECFANMVSGKPNELGKAIEEYLKGVM